MMKNSVNELNGYIYKFLDNQDIVQRSKSTYKNALNQFFSWCINNNISNIDRASILSFKEALNLKGLRAATRCSYLVGVRRFFEWTDINLNFPNVAKNIKGARRFLDNHMRDSLTLDQAKHVLSIIPQDTLKGQRDYAIINLLVKTGLRLIEVVRSDYEDIDMDRRDPLLWIRGKGKDDKSEFIVLTQDVLDPILNYIRKRNVDSKKEPLFTSVSGRNFNQRLTIYSISRMVKNYLIKAGIKNHRITAHSLRHTFGVLAIKSGASLYEVQLAMRHSSPVTTQIYLKDIEREKRLDGSPEKKVSELFLNN